MPHVKTLRAVSFGVSLLAAAHGAFAQGGAAILALDMPPPGGEGLAGLQAGGAFPSGATSLYYNPALLVELARSTGSQAHFAYSSWDFLPGVPADGLKQTFTGGALSIPLPGGLDIGVGLFRNHMDFGQNLSSSGDEEDTTRFNAYEAVHGLGAGLRVLGPFSAGVTVKHYRSALGRAVTDSGETADSEASGWVLDAGVLYYQPFQPASAYGVRSLELVTSAGVAWINHGKRVRYKGREETDPLPESRKYSLGWSIDVADIARGSWSWDWQHYTHDRTQSRDIAGLTYARHFSVLGFGLGWGRVVDPDGQRFETHRSREFAFDLLNGYRVYNRLRKMDWTGSSETQEMGYPFARVSVFGISYRFNPRFVIGERRIAADGGSGLVTGPYTPYFALSL
jgi:hypothetical protein